MRYSALTRLLLHLHAIEARWHAFDNRTAERLSAVVTTDDTADRDPGRIREIGLIRQLVVEVRDGRERERQVRSRL